MSESKVTIPEAAVEAAARAFYGTALDDVSPEDLEYAKEGARIALEAAAPHIRAQALEEAAEFVTSPRAKTTDADLARAGAVQEWLRRRAATYRTAK